MLPLQCPPFAPWKLGHGDLAGTITARELRLTIATDLSGVPPLCHSCSLASLLQLLHSRPTSRQKSTKIALSPNQFSTSLSTAPTVGPNSNLARQLQTPTSLNYHERCQGMVWNLRWWWCPTTHASTVPDQPIPGVTPAGSLCHHEQRFCFVSPATRSTNGRLRICTLW